MAHIVDTRSAGGEFVVLGEALTLPSSSAAGSNPPQGSLRFNPGSNTVEIYSPGGLSWAPLGSGSAGGGSGPGGGLQYQPTTEWLLSGGLTINGDLRVVGNIVGNYFSGTAQYAEAVGTGPNSTVSGSNGSSQVIPFDLSTFMVTASGSSASRTLQARFGEWLNLKDFNAAGDGNTDDTAAVRAWWAALVGGGRPGLVPAGTYIVSAPLVWDMLQRQTGVSIFGTGATTSVFDVSAVSQSPAVTLCCSQGPTAGNRIVGIGFKGGLSGTLLQIGLPDFSDVMDRSALDIAATNTGAGAGTTGIAINAIRASTLWINVRNTPSNGVALQATQLQYSDVFASLSDATVGLYLTGGSNIGNSFRTPSALRVASCVVIDSANTTNNSFYGGQFAWTSGGINATAGSDNVFFNVSAAAASGPLLVNATGVVVTNGAASNTDIVQSLGYPPLDQAGGTMSGALILSNGVGLQFLTNTGSDTGRFGLDGSDTLSLLMDDGAGNARTIFSIPQGNSTALTFGPPLLATLRGNADTATQLQNPLTLSLTGDVAGSVVLGDGSTQPSLYTSLSMPMGAAIGTFNQVAVDGTGRVVQGSFVVDTVSVTGDVVGGGPAGNVTVTLANVASPGTYSAVVVDNKGRVVAGSYISNSGQMFWPAPMTLQVSGDVSGSAAFDGANTTSLTLNLASSVATPGTYVQVTVDATGRVTNGIAVAGGNTASLITVDCGTF